MSNNIGRVDFTVSLDGQNLPGEAENIGRKAGAAASAGYDREWNKGFSATLSESGKKTYDLWSKQGIADGDAYSDALSRRLKRFMADAERDFGDLHFQPGFLDDFGRGFDDAGLAAGDLQEKLGGLLDTGRITDEQFEEAAGKVETWANEQRRAAVESNEHREAVARLNEDLYDQQTIYTNLQQRQREGIALYREQADAYDRIVRQSHEKIDVDYDHDISETSQLVRWIDRLNDSLGENNFQWRDLSHNTRQWTLIIGAVLAGMQDISVLGSAAGAGLLAVGGAAVSAVAGLGTAATVFSILAKDIEDLPPQLQQAKRELQGLGGAFGDLREQAASAAFAEMPGVFSSLEGTVRGLTPQITLMGREIGKLGSEFATNLRPGTAAYKELDRLLSNSVPTFGSLARSSGTFGIALVRAINEADPLVQDLTGYIDTLVTRFDSFTRSDGMTQWVTNAQRVFGPFGQLLDAVGRSLNDLVTPASVTRTAQFLDNLTRFMPDLTAFLDVLGRADLFGLAAEFLAEFGEGLRPLGPAAADLASALNRLVGGVLAELGDDLGAISAVIAPLVQEMADFIGAIPPDAIAGIAHSIVILGGAFLALKGAQAIGGAVVAVQGFVSAADLAAGAGGRLAGSLGTLGRVAGGGLAIGATVLLVDQLARVITEQLVPSTQEVTAGIRGATSGVGVFAETLKAQGINSVSSASELVKNLGRDLNTISNRQWFEGAFTGVESAGSLLKDLGTSLGDLAKTNLPEAQRQFRLLADDANLTSQQQQVLLDQLGPYRDELLLQTGLSTSASDATALLAAAYGTAGAELMTANTATETQVALAALMATQAGATGEAVDGLADKIRNFGSATLDTREANRQFQEAIDAVTASVLANGATLDINTAEGRANEAALDAMAKGAINLAAATYEQTGSIDGATSAIQSGRDALIAQLQQFGYTQEQAAAYADQLGLIPSNVTTLINADTYAAARQVDTFVSSINSRVAYITVRAYNETGSGRPTNIGQFASGSVFTRSTIAEIGEDGPEAVVPLRRDLSRVDPSVRWLSAVAQGKVPQLGSGGMAGGGTQLTVAEGAIVIQDSGDTRRQALDVLEMLQLRAVG